MAKISELTLRIKLDEDWLALTAYRMALRHILELSDDTPWTVSLEADIAREVLKAYPGREE